MNLTPQELDIILTHCESMLDLCDSSDRTKYEVLITKIVAEMWRLSTSMSK